MSGNEVTMHVSLGRRAICRPDSVTAAINSNDCQQCERKLERLIVAACKAVESCEASDCVMNQQKVGRAIRTLRQELEGCHLDIGECTPAGR